jgi:hypothetical protein
VIRNDDLDLIRELVDGTHCGSQAGIVLNLHSLAVTRLISALFIDMPLKLLSCEIVLRSHEVCAVLIYTFPILEADGRGLCEAPAFGLSAEN